MIAALLVSILPVLSSAPDMTVAANAGSRDEGLVRQVRFYHWQVGAGGPGTESESGGTLPQNSRAVGDLSTRLAVLEASRQDLSGWATILVGVVTILVAANIGLSVWQVGSLARKEAEAIIAEYNTQFSGFLSHGQRTIAERLAHYEDDIAELSRRLDEISLRVEKYNAEASEVTPHLQGEE